MPNATAAAVQVKPAPVSLKSDTEAALTRIREQVQTGDSQLAERFETIEAKIAETQKIKDKQKRDVQLAIIMAEIDSLRNEAVQEQADLAQAVMGLNAMIESMGGEFDQLAQYNADEKAIIESAQAKLEGAKTAWFNRDARVKAAEDNLKAETARANQLMRTRLMKADMEQSLQIFQARVQETIGIMERRKEQVKLQIESVTARKTAAFGELQAAAAEVTRLDTVITQKEADLRQAEEHLAQLENGTPEHGAANQQVSNLRAEVESLNAERNAQLAVHQSKEKFVAELEIHQITQTKLHGNITIWIKALKSDTAERVVTFRSRLEAMRAMSDQDVAANLDKLGVVIDKNNADYMARAGNVSDKIRLRRMQDQPTRMRDMAEISAGQARATAETLAGELKVREEFQKKYGIDPFASSFLKQGEQHPAESIGA